MYTEDPCRECKTSLSRAPFLHDDLVEWANGICIEDKADLSLPRGVGEKKMIREVSGSLLKLSD